MRWVNATRIVTPVASKASVKVRDQNCLQSYSRSNEATLVVIELPIAIWPDAALPTPADVGLATLDPRPESGEQAFAMKIGQFHASPPCALAMAARSSGMAGHSMPCIIPFMC